MSRTAIKFGAFVAVCLGFTLLLATTIGNTSLSSLVGRGESTYEIEASFNDVTGLLLDDNVKVAGVVVGKVTGIEVESGQALVKMRIRSSTPPMAIDTTAQIRWRNLIGQRYVYLLPGEAPVAIQDGAAIPTTISVVDLGELFNRLGPIVGALDSSQINAFLETVGQALEGNEASVSKTIDDLAFFVKGLADRDQAIGRLLVNLETVAGTVADRDAQIQTIFENLAALAETFSDNTALLETSILELGAFNRDLSHLLTSNRGEVDRILLNLDILLTTVEGKLGPIDIALKNLPETADAIFSSSRNGEFLNQAILCASASVPPCPSPIVTGLSAGTSGAQGYQLGVDPSGNDAMRSLFAEVLG
jgi:phospholipid/cholesterol/gamma-HCH transport system substrate-binding protein